MKFSKENRDTPLSLIHKFFSIRHKVWNTECTFAKFFGPVRQNFFDKTIMPPSYASQFLVRKFNWNTEGLNYEDFSDCETNKFNKNKWYPLLMRRNFRYWNFLKPWRFRPLNFLALWDIKFSTENRDTPALSLTKKTFSIPYKIWNTDGTPCEVFRSCETKICRQNHDAHTPSF